MGNKNVKSFRLRRTNIDSPRKRATLHIEPMGDHMYQVTEKDAGLRTRSSSIESLGASQELADIWLKEYPNSEIQIFDDVMHTNAMASPTTERRRTKELFKDWRKDILSIQHRHKVRDIPSRRQSDVVNITPVQIHKLKPRAQSVSNDTSQIIPRSNTFGNI
jgi:hypothetical protein